MQILKYQKQSKLIYLGTKINKFGSFFTPILILGSFYSQSLLCEYLEVYISLLRYYIYQQVLVPILIFSIQQEILFFMLPAIQGYSPLPSCFDIYILEIFLLQIQRRYCFLGSLKSRVSTSPLLVLIQFFQNFFNEDLASISHDQDVKQNFFFPI